MLAKNQHITMKLSQNQLIPLIVACALFMENLDASIITTALPVMAQSLNTSPLQLNLAITAYVFSIAVFIPLSGWLADRYGARRIFCAAIIVFMAGSLGCGMAANLPQLIGARLIQGLGGAMMVPVGRLVLLRTVPKNQLIGAMAWVTTPALIGPVVGPPLGGLIATYADWRWIFFINIPIGLLGLYMALRFIPDIREAKRTRFDSFGFILMALGLAALVLSFESLNHSMFPAGSLPWILGSGLLALILYLWHTKRHSAPLIDPKLFRHATFRLTACGGFLFRVGVGGLPFLLPLLFQLGFGMTALASGLLTFVAAVGAFFMKPIASFILRRYGFRRVLLVNTGFSALSIAVTLFFQPQTPILIILALLFLGGLSRSLQFTSLNTLVYADVKESEMSNATTVASMLQQLSTSFGVGLAAFMLGAVVGDTHTGYLPPSAFMPAIMGLSVICLAALLLLWRLKPDAGQDMSGHNKNNTTT